MEFQFYSILFAGKILEGLISGLGLADESIKVCLDSLVSLGQQGGPSKPFDAKAFRASLLTHDIFFEVVWTSLGGLPEWT